MKIISFVNKKGRVGKTTSALALAHGLSKRNFKVLAIDCDAQGNFSKASGAEQDQDVVGIYDVLLGKENINDSVQELKFYDLIGSDRRLSGIDSALTKLGREYRLKKSFEELEKEYDYCIIDCPPALNVSVANSLVASDEIIICSSAEAFSLDGLMELSASIDDVRAFMNPELKVNGILLTMFNPRTIVGQHNRDQLKKIAEKMKTRVYETFIRRCNTVSVSQADRKSVFDYPSSNAAKDYLKFVEEFLWRRNGNLQ